MPFSIMSFLGRWIRPDDYVILPPALRRRN